MKTDTQLQRDVEDELKWDPSVGRVEIGVAAKDGVVTLGGTVPSYAQKYAADRAAERVKGVRAVADDLEVKLPGSARRTDTEIAHTVANALAWDVEVPEEEVKARVDNGWVWLEGTVDWYYQRDAAERDVRYLTGVRGVTNLLEVKVKAAWAAAGVTEVEDQIFVSI